MRNYSFLDTLLMHLDNAVRTVTTNNLAAQRANPAEALDESALSDSERQHVTGLMRVNYSGEVSAQALYQGQAMVARSADVKSKLQQAAIEENDHLVWCHERISELQGRTSYFDPFWYAGSFCIGAIAGVISDRLSMGFLAETEYQVIRHIDDHLQQLPDSDEKTKVILQQMRTDEAQYATTAINMGATELPYPVKEIMEVMSKVMTNTAYWA